jgi:DNA-binding transcriptional regulator YhcF (GntR family)
MDLVLNRRGGVPVRDQLVAQLELQILGGVLRSGQKLPSVRALARRLDIHANTVSAAYRDLEASGHVELRRGAGVFVRRGAPASLEEARGLDEMIRLALRAAFRKGHSAVEIRDAVERWLKAVRPERLVVVDPSPEMGELVAREVREVLSIPVSSCSVKEAQATPTLLSGALVLTLPYHAGTVVKLAPSSAVEILHLEFSRKDQELLHSLPAGSTVLVISHSPTILPFASVLLHALRGDELLAQVKLLARSREWKRILPVADLVLVDALAADAIKGARAKRVREFRVLTESALQRLKKSVQGRESQATRKPML